ncbi:MAG: hypothetical protein OXE52_16580 [Chloroflexi bacterium]|nr:hypothetical protein [Chloroflexota bacterium]
MRRYSIITSVLLLFALLVTSQAQDESNYSSTINWFYSACEDRMVVDLYGNMQAGYDVYYQAFDLFGGNGTAITALRRVAVNDDYSTSQVVNWLGRSTRALGTPISVVFRIGRENDPDDTIFQEASDDYLDECEEPGSTLEEEPTLGTGDVIGSSGVFTPDGGLLNPIYYKEPEPLVQIGARPSESEIPGRTADPGLIFAECADVPGADPGVLYDTDEIRLFWSWFAKTAEQVQDHLNNAQYIVKLRGLTIPDIRVSEIKQIPGSLNWWVFYTVNLGGKWEPGRYGIDFNLRWANPISDGYEEFGPGTANELLDSGCLFVIERNPWDIPVIHENPTLPLSAYND